MLYQLHFYPTRKINLCEDIGSNKKKLPQYNKNSNNNYRF